MSRHNNFPITINHPETDEAVEAEAFFFFWPGRCYMVWDSPTEPPEVDILDITHGGVSVLNKLSESQYRKIEGDLLAVMMEDYYNDVLV
jgi:hypothetical protein